MIITISGPSSTGKTTLFNILKNNKKVLLNKLPNIDNIVFVEESIREVVYADSLEDIYKDKNLSMKLQIKVMDYCINQYKNYFNNKNTLYICDRSILDNYIYFIINYIRLGEDRDDLISRDKFYKYVEIIHNLYRKIDKVYLTRTDLSSKPKKDNFRPTVLNDFRELEIILFDSIFSFQDNVCILPDSDRFQYVIDKLEE